MGLPFAAHYDDPYPARTYFRDKLSAKQLECLLNFGIVASHPSSFAACEGSTCMGSPLRRSSTPAQFASLQAIAEGHAQIALWRRALSRTGNLNLLTRALTSVCPGESSSVPGGESHVKCVMQDSISSCRTCWRCLCLC